MKVVLPLWDLSLYPRYRNQFIATRKYLDELVIITEDSRCFIDGKVDKWSKEDNISFECIPFDNKWDRPKYYLNAIKDINPDVLYTLSGFFFELCSWYSSSKTGIPIVMRLRGNDIMMRKKTRIFYKVWVYRFFYSLMWKNYDKIIPISFRLKDEFEKKYKLKNIVSPVYNGYDYKMFKNEGSNINYDFGYVGRLNDDKNSGFLIKLIENTPSIKYCLIGENQGNYKIPSNADYLGVLNKKDVSKYGYNNWNYTLLPSFYEGVPNVVMESYLCETPVIVSSAAIPYDIRVFGYSVDLDLNKWINLLKSLKTNKYVKSVDFRKYVVDNFKWDKFSYYMYMNFLEVLDEKNGLL